MKIVLNCAGAWLSGWGLAFLLAWGDYMGSIYFDLRAFVYLGGFFAVLFGALSLYNDLILENKGANNE